MTVRRGWLALASLLFGLGAVYALVVPLGLPYDEPAHWENVLHISRTGTLPEVGDPDVSYEAVQGPLAYAVDAIVAAPLDALGVSENANLRVNRIFNSGWLIAFAAVLVALLRRVAPSSSDRERLASAVLVAGSPILVAIGASVQNDLPALVLTGFGLIRFLDARERGGWRSHVVVGAVIGLAFLAKASVWPVGVVLGAVLLLGKRFREFAAFTSAGLAVSGWWIVRNLVEYGSVTGNNAVADAGYDFPPLGFHGVETAVHLVRNTVTFLWIPVEYWRNTVDAPTWLTLVVVLVTLVVVGLGARRAVPVNAPSMTVASLALVAVVAWAITTVFIQDASFRLAYLALPFWGVLVLASLRQRPWVLRGLGGAVVVMHAWLIWAVAT